MARQINGCKGPSGSNREYVLQLASALRDMGEDPEDQTFLLERLLLK